MRSPVIDSLFWFLKAFPSAVMMLAGLENGCPSVAGVATADAAGIGAPDCCWSLEAMVCRHLLKLNCFRRWVGQRWEFEDLPVINASKISRWNFGRPQIVLYSV